MNPLGGLPRRKIALAKLDGSPLVIDAGNALFRAPGLDDDASKQRAKFILKTMGDLGTQVMAVGARDLVGGLPFLLEAAKGSKVKLLSANLRDKEKPVFEASVVLKAGSTRVGVIGVSPASTGIPPLAAVSDELKKLKGKTDVIIVLAAVPYPDALQISTELKSQIDVVLQSTESRATPAQLSEGNLVIGSGERGRSLGKLTLGLAGKGPWASLDQAAQDQQQVEILDSRIAEFKKRRALTKDAAALKELDGTLKEWNARRAEMSAKANAPIARGARTFKLDWVALDAATGDDEQLKAAVLKFEPTYAAPH